MGNHGSSFIANTESNLAIREWWEVEQTLKKKCRKGQNASEHTRPFKGKTSSFKTNKQSGRLAKEYKMEDYTEKILLLGMGRKWLKPPRCSDSAKLMLREIFQFCAEDKRARIKVPEDKIFLKNKLL